MDVGKICWPIKPLHVKHHPCPVEILKTAGFWQGNTDTGPSEQEDLPVFKRFIVSNLLKNSIHVLSCPALQIFTVALPSPIEKVCSVHPWKKSAQCFWLIGEQRFVLGFWITTC